MEEVLFFILEASMPAKTILIVDDLLTLRHPVRLILERQGYAVEEAGNGQEALQKIAEKRPDLVLLDLMMPSMNGAEFLEHIRSDAVLQDMPVIVLTAVANKWQMRKYLDMGITDYLLKPFTSSTLLERVRYALGEKEPAG
jgi:two-component system phosphate regulon response regulator PhoB